MQKKLLHIYEALEPAYEKVIVENFDSGNKAYISILKAAFAKSYEFNCLCNSQTNDRDAYFLMSSLRGICEDLIALKYMRDHLTIEQNELIGLMTSKRNLEGIQVQQEFFDKHKPDQLNVQVDNTETKISHIISQIKQILIKNGLKGDKEFPSVAQMATDTKLIKLYNYVYYATSKTVHFEPGLLLRLGWSKNIGDTNFKFSTRNFGGYYSLFNSYYASFLFIEFYNTFKNQLDLTKEFKKPVKKIKDILNDELRMPEIITYEELNIKPPSTLIRLMIKAAVKK